ncbi:MAG: hypothetical protein JNK64_39840 [Myxococcales bacterium]|nr:hypothetical protein [Myxococcales bacterium]
MIVRAAVPTRIAGIALIALGASVATARAQALPPITDRAWTLDLYDGAAIGSARIVGMGGVQLATAEGSAGTLANPAAPAVRPATSTERWDWDFHLDALSAVVASDFDNNGLADADRDDRRTSFGIAGVYGPWGVAIVGGAATVGLPTPDGALTASTSVGKLAVGYAPGDETWSVGAAVRVGRLDVEGAQPMFALVGSGLEVGGLYRPFHRALRIGAVASLAVPGKDVETAACDPSDCAGYILPQRVEVPWQVGVGVAWRFAPTAWNQWVGGRFRDERQVIVAADLVVAGPVAGGMGLEAFARKQWQPSGRAASWWLRGGVEWEALPGRVRLRGGSYWEPARFAGVGGRVHATGGVEVAVVSVRAWSRRYRIRAGVTADFARAFGNAGLAVGFWH